MTEDPALFRLFNEISIIAQLSQRMLENAMPRGMTMAQFIVLNHFARLGGERSPAELADAIQVTRATMTSTLQKLASKGFVHISPNAEDGRAKRVVLTEAGRAMRMACVDAVSPRIQALGQVISPAQIMELLPQLASVRRRLDAERGKRATATPF